MVGSLDDLDVSPPDASLRRTLPPASTPEELLAAAVHARDGLLALREQLGAELPDRAATPRSPRAVEVLRLPHLPVDAGDRRRTAGPTRPSRCGRRSQSCVDLVEECVAISHEKLLPEGDQAATSASTSS